MKNEELLCRHGSRLNPFTTALRDACLANGKALVRMRGGDWCEVAYEPPEGEHPWDDCPHGGFRSVDNIRYWTANGESITGDRFDLIEFETPKTSDQVVEASLPDTARRAVVDVVEYIAAQWADCVCDGLEIDREIRNAGESYLKNQPKV